MVVIGRRLLRHDPARLLRDDTAALFPLRALRVASVVLPQTESVMHVKASPSKHDNERQGERQGEVIRGN
jgi:hypothetical protein